MPPRRFRDRVLRRGARRAAGRVLLDVAPGLPERDTERIREVIRGVLQSHDPLNRRADAEAVVDAYLSLSDDGRRNFLAMLASDFWSDPAVVDEAVKVLHETSVTEPDRKLREQQTRAALTPPVHTLLHLFTGLEGGVKFVVDLRADALRLAAVEPGLRDLDRELQAHVADLSDVGLLTLQRITWEAPAALLEKLIAYEAVHAISSWDDLKNRLDSDRRCYAFFHPSMPGEPLVFVEIALTDGVATEMPPLLDARAPDLDVELADTAVFYSISNCQPGLAGVNLGTALIKQVIEALRKDLPQLQRFVTLSPMPGFRRWVDDRLQIGTGLSANEIELLPAEPDRVVTRLHDVEWEADEAIRPGLLALAARYLTATPEGRVVDPVGNFHLSNGAAVERINWMADPSPVGRDRSYGLMANYLYEPDALAERAEAYAAGQVTASAAVRDLLAD